MSVSRSTFSRVDTARLVRQLAFGAAVVVVAVVSVSCSGGSGPVAVEPAAVAATAVPGQRIEPTGQPEPTATAEPTPEPTSTVEPSATPEPTPTVQTVFLASDAEPAADPDEEPLKYAAEFTALQYMGLVDEFSMNPESFSRDRLAPYTSPGRVNELGAIYEAREGPVELDAAWYEVVLTVVNGEHDFTVLLCGYASGRILDGQGGVVRELGSTGFHEVYVEMADGRWQATGSDSGGWKNGEVPCDQLLG